MVRGCKHSSRAWDTRSLTVNMWLPAKALLEYLASSVYIAGSSRLNEQGSFAQILEHE